MWDEFYKAVCNVLLFSCSFDQQASNLRQWHKVFKFDAWRKIEAIVLVYSRPNKNEYVCSVVSTTVGLILHWQQHYGHAFYSLFEGDK